MKWIQLFYWVFCSIRFANGYLILFHLALHIFSCADVRGAVDLWVWMVCGSLGSVFFFLYHKTNTRTELKKRVNIERTKSRKKCSDIDKVFKTENTKHFICVFCWLHTTNGGEKNRPNSNTSNWHCKIHVWIQFCANANYGRWGKYEYMYLFVHCVHNSAWKQVKSNFMIAQV